MKTGEVGHGQIQDGGLFSTPLPSRRHASFDFNVFSVPHGPDLGEKHMKDFGA